MDNEPTIKSVTTRLPIELYEEFAIAARRRQIPIKDAFEQAIRAWLDTPPPPPRITEQQLAVIERILFNPSQKSDIRLKEYLLLIFRQAEEDAGDTER